MGGDLTGRLTPQPRAHQGVGGLEAVISGATIPFGNGVIREAQGQPKVAFGGLCEVKTVVGKGLDASLINADRDGGGGLGRGAEGGQGGEGGQDQSWGAAAASGGNDGGGEGQTHRGRDELLLRVLNVIVV